MFFVIVLGRGFAEESRYDSDRSEGRRHCARSLLIRHRSYRTIGVRRSYLVGSTEEDEQAGVEEGDDYEHDGAVVSARSRVLA